MQDWLSDYAAALASEMPDRSIDLPPSSQLADSLLDLARLVAEGTGQKINAPLSSFMVGRFVGVLAESGVAPEAAVALASEIAQRVLEARE